MDLRSYMHAGDSIEIDASEEPKTKMSKIKGRQKIVKKNRERFFQRNEHSLNKFNLLYFGENNCLIWSLIKY